MMPVACVPTHLSIPTIIGMGSVAGLVCLAGAAAYLALEYAARRLTKLIRHL